MTTQCEWLITMTHCNHTPCRYVPYVSSKEIHIFAKEPYISAKEPYIFAKEPYISAKEPYIFAKELF